MVPPFHSVSFAHISVQCACRCSRVREGALSLRCDSLDLRVALQSTGPDWSCEALLPLRAAMSSPELHRPSLDALLAYSAPHEGETWQSPSVLARQAALEAAVDWVLFVLGVAGSDSHTADKGCCVLVRVTQGLPSDQQHRLLRLVHPVLQAMEVHPLSAVMACKGVVTLANLAADASCREPLRQAGAQQAVQKALGNHPAHAAIQWYGQEALTCLAAPLPSAPTP
jgi:hypothetical protein